ncbi:hypothetical protein B0H67DRAFT_594961 [Lasiosphaeris hirsuta]|uniref:Uncharacterized protein n=1 Tax=Lasiosphaeris hirsuta TaxID=260670 RepID=A0AA39ZSG8_9PEZI|nr:hypothetical protein B0H67DRAFT_594961 [Lasiosphaeris hirsuta]
MLKSLKRIYSRLLLMRSQQVRNRKSFISNTLTRYYHHQIPITHLRCRRSASCAVALDFKALTNADYVEALLPRKHHNLISRHLIKRRPESKGTLKHTEISRHTPTTTRRNQGGRAECSLFSGVPKQ